MAVGCTPTHQATTKFTLSFAVFEVIYSCLFYFFCSLIVEDLFRGDPFF